jgi:hypothetical protein
LILFPPTGMLHLTARTTQSNQKGVLSTRFQATLPGYGMVWFDPNGIANILYLSNVKKKYGVIFDSHIDDIFHMHKPAQNNSWHCAMGGLYFMDIYREIIKITQHYDD